MQYGPAWRQIGRTALAVAVLLPAACTETKEQPREISRQDTSLEPEELLHRLRQKYLTSKSYVDNAVMVERGISRSRGTLEELPYSRTSLVYAKPNKYALSYEYGMNGPNATRYRVVSDGTRVRSMATELPEQIHETFASRIPTPENLIPEPELRQAILDVSIENLFPQLSMILTDDMEKPIFPRATAMELLAEDKIDEVKCYRLAITEPEGTRVLWIDKEAMILRRMELPIDHQRKQIDPAGQYRSFSVDLDFKDIIVDAELDDAAFVVTVPQEVRLVRRFVPPPPAPPSNDLGKPVKQFEFADVDGGKITPADLRDKVTVLEFWATDCAPCKQHTPLLEEAYQQLKDDDAIEFFGVSTDPEGLATSAVAKALKSWGASFPLLRDPEKDSYYSLNVKATPTLILLGPDGRLQAFHIGLLESADELVKRVRRLQNGEDLVQVAKDEHAKELEDYEAILQAATIKNSLVLTKTEPAEIPPRKLPEALNAEETWHSESADLKNPGDIALVASGDSSLDEIVVIDANNAIVRLDSEGNALGRTELPGSAESESGFVRTAVAKDENWYLVGGGSWQRVHLFDRNLKNVLTFPDELHSGIGDAALIDLGQGGPSILVGYWGGRGVQLGTIDGQRGWINRHLDHVLQIVAGPESDNGQPSVWCTSTRGTVFEISADGKLQREFPVVGHTMVALEPTAPGGDEPRCGLSMLKPEQYALVAFDDEGEVAWSYQLPEGGFAGPIPPIQRVDLGGHQICRLAAGPDGSIHFVTAEGNLIDRFDYGQEIKGLAAASLEEGTLLWVSAGNRLTGWRISVDETP